MANITCTVKGYQECRFTVDVGEEFFFGLSSRTG